MKVAGGLLIALGIFITIEVLSGLAFAARAQAHPFSIGEFISYWWPAPIVFAVGILLRRYKPRNKIY